MQNKCIFKLKTHKEQMSRVYFCLPFCLIFLIIGLISLLSGDSKTFSLCFSGFIFFLFVLIFNWEKLESYEIYEDVIIVKNRNREINRVFIKDIKVVKIKLLSTDAKYTKSFKSFVFCDGRNEINNTMKHPGDFDYFLNNSKVCVRIYYNEKLEDYLKAKNIEII